MRYLKRQRSKTSFQSAERIGKLAEFLIYLSYACRGFRLIARRQRTPFGEIDLVLRRRAHIRFIEVKYRKSCPDIAQLIPAKQMARLARASTYLYHQLSCNGHDSCQFDIVVIHGTWRNRSWRISYFPNHIDMR